MTRFDLIRQQLDSIRPNDFGREQLVAARSSVLRLMGDGTPTAEKVAQSMGMHTWSFRRRIKEVTDVTANDYITFVRLQQAVAMLADHPRYNISQVAQQCGYADAAHLNHTFRLWMDMSPTQYVSLAEQQRRGHQGQHQ